jgi:hypothetical protein
MPGCPATANELDTHLTTLAQQCWEESVAQAIITDLRHSTFGLRAQRSEASITRKTTRMLFPHFVQCVMGPLMIRQQKLLRDKLGTRLGIDHSYKSVASLTATVEGALTRTGARKMGSYHASVATVTAEGGYALAAVVAPNDSHDLIVAMLCGLLGAELPRDLEHLPYLNFVKADIAGKGALGHLPVAIFTDDSNKDINLWRRVHKNVLQAWRSSGKKIYSPWGVVFLPSKEALHHYQNKNEKVLKTLW